MSCLASTESQEDDSFSFHAESQPADGPVKQKSGFQLQPRLTLDGEEDIADWSAELQRVLGGRAEMP